MGTTRYTVALLCVVLLSLRSDAVDRKSTSLPSPKFKDFESTTIRHKSETTTQNRFVNDPFALIGEDNILGPQPNRRKVIRRTRRRRIKKVRSTTTTTTTSTTEAPSLISSTLESSDYYGPSGGGGGSASVSTSTENVRIPVNPKNQVTIRVVPIDSLLLTTTEDTSESLPSPSPNPSSPPSTKAPDPIFRSGHYTRHQKKRKRLQTKADLWGIPAPNFSVELFDTDGTEEDGNTNNMDKRESRRNRTNVNVHNMFNSKPTTLSNLTDMNTDESVNPYVNTSSPISTELQNSLQFTLQVLHPLLNSDTVLTEKNPKIPENKTVAVTHSLSSSIAETPISPDLRFLPIQLRKSHPFLSEDSLLNSYGPSKTGPRVNVHTGLHSMRNNPRGTLTSTSTSTSTTTAKTTMRTSSTSSSTTARTTTSSRRTPTVPFSRRPISRIPSVGHKSTTESTTKKVPPSVNTTPKNNQLDALGNLKITELVYPTVQKVQKIELATSSTGTPETSTPSSTTTSTSTTSTTTARIPTFVTTRKKSSSTPKLKIKIHTEYDNYDNRSPPLILMGTEPGISELGVQGKGSIERPSVFDDLLLEELVKGFVPPITTKKPIPTTTTTTTTTTTSTTTTTTTTTPRPTTTTPRRRTTPKSTTIITTTTPAPVTEPTKTADDETAQLLQLLRELQLLQQATETLSSTTPFSTTTTPYSTTPYSTTPYSTTSTSTSTTINPLGNLNDDFLKNLALFETLLSPTAKTMIKEAVETGTTEKIAATQNQPAGGNGEGLSDADLKAIYMLLDAMSSTTPRPPTTTTPKPTVNPAQAMLNILSSSWSDIQKLRGQQNVQNTINTAPSKPTFTIPQPPKPVPTTSSLDLLSQIFNLSPQTEKPKQNQNSDLGLGSLFENLLPTRHQSNREATAGSNQLLNFFPEQRPSTPKPGPYYWFDVNAFLGNDPNTGFRPKVGTREYFLKVRRRRNSMESYY